MLPACLLASGAWAQSAQGAATPPVRAAQNPQLRSQISMLEAVLERAVQQGVSKAIEKVPGAELSGPIWIGQQRARGFHVDGYGVFFDISVPELPVTITWSVQMLGLNDAALRTELARLSAAVASVTDSKQRTELEQATASLQRLAGASNASAAPAPPTGGATPTRVANQAQPPQAPFSQMVAPPDAPTPPQLRAIYRAEMQAVLIDAVLDQGRLLQMGPDERLTLAARMEGSGLTTSQDPTVFLTIRGRDLAALNTGRISREEAQKGIEVVWK